MPQFTRQLWLKGLLAFAFWSLLGVAFGTQFYFSSAQFGNPVSWGRALAYSLADWYVFALLSVPAIALARRFPIERQRWRRSVMVHVLASLLFSVAYIGSTMRDAVAFGLLFAILLLRPQGIFGSAAQRRA